MGAIKNYMSDLADELGKDFEELTQEDFDKSVRENTKLCEWVNYHLHKRNTVIKTVMEFGELREEVL